MPTFKIIPVENMKRLLLSCMMLASAFVANAQIWVGGALGYGHTSDGPSTYSIAPTIGYDLSSKWAIGLEADYSFTNASRKSVTALSISDLKDKTWKLSVLPFVRYNCFESGIVTIFLDGGVGYTYSREKYDSYYDNFTYEGNKGQTMNRSPKSNGMSVGIRPGVKIAVTPKISVETHLGFIGYSLDKKSLNDFTGTKMTSHKVGFNLGSTALNFGMIYSF